MSTQDRELLELAAKAYFDDAVIEKYVESLNCLYVHHITCGTLFAPLTDDGDALRLAVKLSMWLMIRGGYTDVMFGEARTPFICEYHGDDPYAATRRAIVRAAAEIGRML